MSGAAQASQQLQGTWRVTVTPAGPDAAPFLNFTLFTGDGGLVTISANGTASVGEWTALGGNRFALWFVGMFVQGDQSIAYRIRSTITLNETADGFSGPFVVEDVIDDRDSGEAVTPSGSGTMQGARIRIEPLG